MMFRTLGVFLFVLVFLFVNSPLLAATYTTISSGNWNNNSIWSLDGGATPCNCRPGNDPNGHYHLLSVINKKTKKKIEISKLKDPLLSSGKDIELIVTNFKIKYDKSGEPFGIAFKNYLIDIKPHILKNFTSLLDSVTTVKINGILRDPSSGFINLGSYTVVTAISIEIENKHYMLM